MDYEGVIGMDPITHKYEVTKSTTAWFDTEKKLRTLLENEFRMSQDFYLGNPNLKKVGTEIQFTKEQIQEYLKCKEDPVYFAMNYIKIISLDEV